MKMRLKYSKDALVAKVAAPMERVQPEKKAAKVKVQKPSKPQSKEE